MVNAPLRGIKKISEYNEYIFSIFGYILNTIVDGELKEKRGNGGRTDMCAALCNHCGFARKRSPSITLPRG
jgi:hypothetical protein